ncbi:MAG: DUF2461 domain-containing protein [Thermoanaerobaculia bacterium]
MPQAHFSPKLFKFLKELAANNDRDWFQANKDRYENDVREPAQAFISDFGPQLRKISPHFRADPRKVGGSLFRIHRDVRFSKDKSPYKTHTGIQFRHKQGKDAHAPGFYLHIEPGRCFGAVGIWHPDGETTKNIREFLVENTSRWKRIMSAKRFRDTFELQGDSLKRPPRGFDPEHPLIEDLRRKDFIGVHSLSQKDVASSDFLKRYTGLCRTGAAFVKALCEASGIAF